MSFEATPAGAISFFLKSRKFPFPLLFERMVTHFLLKRK